LPIFRTGLQPNEIAEVENDIDVLDTIGELAHLKT
jgi:hypothetical protein